MTRPKGWDEAVREVRHALRIGATHEEWAKAVKKYSRKVVAHIPLGELIGNLAGSARVWKKQGRIGEVESIEKKDRLNAQGLEGKVTIEMSLYDAVLVEGWCEEKRIGFTDAARRKEVAA